MSRYKKKINKRKKKIKKLLLLFIIFIGVFFCSLIVYGEDVFYVMKTYLYEDKASEIKIEVEKNDELENINLNFINKGTCDVYLRGFVFVYTKSEDNTGTILSNSAVKINYGDENSWFVGDDSYVYYTKPLEVNDRTEKPMIESIEVNLCEEDKKMLGENKLKVDIVMESVQVNNFAYKYEWDMKGVDIEDLYENNSEEEGSKIIEEKNIIKMNFN